MADVASTIGTIRYYAGWADKIQGKVIEVPLISSGFSSPDLHLDRPMRRSSRTPDTSLMVSLYVF